MPYNLSDYVKIVRETQNTKPWDIQKLGVIEHLIEDMQQESRRQIEGYIENPENIGENQLMQDALDLLRLSSKPQTVDPENTPKQQFDLFTTQQHLLNNAKELLSNLRAAQEQKPEVAVAPAPAESESEDRKPTAGRSRGQRR